MPSLADDEYWSPDFQCENGHYKCSLDNSEGGPCSGQQTLWDEREFLTPSKREMDNIMRSLGISIDEQ